MDLARERFRFRHPVDGWCAGGWITMAQCDPMETGVQASSGWMMRRQVLNHSGPVWSDGNHGWNWDFMGFHEWGETAPRGQFTWSIILIFFPLSLFFIIFFFSLLSHFSWAFFFLSFFFFLKYHTCALCTGFTLVYIN